MIFKEITKQLYAYLQSGILAFYRGWSVVAIRALPVSSVALPTYMYDFFNMYF